MTPHARTGPNTRARVHVAGVFTGTHIVSRRGVGRTTRAEAA